MKTKACFLVFLLSMSFGYVLAQDLRDLRATPDTSFVENQEQQLDIRTINVPIPRLDLTVNYWKHWTKFGINMNQAAFSNNWGAGGVNSVAWSSTGWHKSEYNKRDFNFTTEIELRYGKVKNENQLAKKNTDRIFWDNKLGYEFVQNWSVFASLTFESIFDVGYNYGRDEETGEEIITGIRTAFMAPGYITESLGIEYKPDNTFSLRFGTGTARQTLVLDDRVEPAGDGSRFGVEAGRRLRNELAFQITANLDRNIGENFNIKSRYNLFADYTEITKPDHRFDTTLTAKISSIISVTARGALVYDRTFIAEGDDRAMVQYSQELALGLLFSFPR